jgi:hypothetical protein
VLGSLWESVVLSSIQAWFPDVSIYFYRTSNGAELDFICSKGSKTIAVECKASISPGVAKGSYLAMEDNNLIKLAVIAPVENGWRKSENTQVLSLAEAESFLRNELEL